MSWVVCPWFLFDGLIWQRVIRTHLVTVRAMTLSLTLARLWVISRRGILVWIIGIIMIPTIVWVGARLVFRIARTRIVFLPVMVLLLSITIICSPVRVITSPMTVMVLYEGGPWVFFPRLIRILRWLTIFTTLMKSRNCLVKIGSY